MEAPTRAQAAKFDFVDEMLAWSGATEPKRILDVGCGFGGTSRHLAKKFPHAAVEGKRLVRCRHRVAARKRLYQQITPHASTPAACHAFHKPRVVLAAGITLSKEQVRRATELAEEQGVSNAHFQVMDALAMTWPDDSFDLVWACESGEHMPDKKRYVEEMTRVLKPGRHSHHCYHVLGCNKACPPGRRCVSSG